MDLDMDMDIGMDVDMDIDIDIGIYTWLPLTQESRVQAWGLVCC